MSCSYNEVESKSTSDLEPAPFLTSPPILPPLKLTSTQPTSYSMSQRLESMYQTTTFRRSAISTRSMRNGSLRTNTRNFNPKSLVYHQAISTQPRRGSVARLLDKLLQSSNNVSSSLNESLAITTETPLSPTRNFSHRSLYPSSSASLSSPLVESARSSVFKIECSPSSSFSSFRSYG